MGIRQGERQPGRMPDAMRDDYDEQEQKKVKHFFVVIGRLDLRPGEMCVRHDERPGPIWSILFAFQVIQTTKKILLKLNLVQHDHVYLFCNIQWFIIIQARTILTSLAMSKSFCVGDDDIDRKLQVAASSLFSAGVMTFFQSWIGIR